MRYQVDRPFILLIRDVFFAHVPTAISGVAMIASEISRIIQTCTQYSLHLKSDDERGYSFTGSMFSGLQRFAEARGSHLAQQMRPPLGPRFSLDLTPDLARVFLGQLDVRNLLRYRRVVFMIVHIRKLVWVLQHLPLAVSVNFQTRKFRFIRHLSTARHPIA